MPSQLPRLVAGTLLVVAATLAQSAAPTPERVLELCVGVEGPAHCGRRIEAEQLKSLPNLAVRDGDTLKVSLYPSGTREFVDTHPIGNERGYALWDYWSPVNAVVLLVTSGEATSFALLQRATGNLTTLPAEPVLAPDRQRLVVADFCSRQCANELSVWRIARDGVRRELWFKPPAAWSDVTATWKNGDTLTLSYTLPGEEARRSVERKLSAADWQRQ
ncbi:MAG: hypothetical protein IT521_14155 [Burkholderiales bacterium]|nr:hypothetical protein [Burkholderiales bacterium]